MKKEYALNIFDVLKQINRKNYGFYESLSDDDKKHINPYLLMCWMRGTSDSSQLLFLNHFVNPYVFGCGTAHKELIMYLLTICGPNKDYRYKWIKSNKKQTSQPLSMRVIKEYFNYSTSHAKQALSLLNADTIISYGEQLGFQSDELTKLKKEWK